MCLNIYICTYVAHAQHKYFPSDGSYLRCYFYYSRSLDTHRMVVFSFVFITFFFEGIKYDENYMRVFQCPLEVVLKLPDQHYWNIVFISRRPFQLYFAKCIIAFVDKVNPTTTYITTNSTTELNVWSR